MAGWGAGGRDHLSGDLRGPGSPCFRPPLPRDRGGGYFLCEKRRRGVVGEGNMYGLFPCVPVPLCSVGAGRAADPCSGEWGPGGTGECSWACGGRVVREGGVPHRAGSEHGFATRCWSSGRWVGASRGRGRGGRSARVPRADPNGPAQAMRRGWWGAGLQGRGGGVGLGWARGLR